MILGSSTSFQLTDSQFYSFEFHLTATDFLLTSLRTEFPWHRCPHNTTWDLQREKILVSFKEFKAKPLYFMLKFFLPTREGLCYLPTNVYLPLLSY